MPGQMAHSQPPPHQQWMHQQQQNPFSAQQQPPSQYPQQQQQQPIQQNYWQHQQHYPQQQQQNVPAFPNQNFPPPQSQPQQQLVQQPQQQFYQYNQQQFGQPSYPQQQNLNNFPQAESVATNESDPWNWGWDENRAIAVQPQQQQQQQAIIHQNANIIEDSFSNSDATWNWSVDVNQASGNIIQENRIQPDTSNANVDTNVLAESAPNIKTLRDKDALAEHNLQSSSTRGRYHNETPLTPQWSLDSQPSQESSDGILTESTNHSENPSRSSEKSSPSLTTNENTNFNYVNTSFNVENVVNQELVQGVRTMHVSRVSSSPDNTFQPQNPPENLMNPLSVHGATPPPAKVNVPLPPISIKQGAMPTPGGSGLPLPPTNIPGPARAGILSHKSANRKPQILQPPIENDVVNSRSSPFVPEQDGRQSHSPALPPTIRHQPNTYSSANLETTPENSERLDTVSPVNYRQTHFAPPAANIVENFEIAPNNDRNEYMQTGHLSDANYVENTNFISPNDSNVANDSYPGFTRMVLGQPENEFGQNSSFGADEPPPGLSRMVPGQLTDSPNIYSQGNDDYLDRQIDGQTTESDSLNNSAYAGSRNPAAYRQVDGQPTDDESNYGQSRNSVDRRPIGLDRMVPGEPSNNSYIQQFQPQTFPAPGDTRDRLVTGNNPELRERNMDGSDYSEIDNNPQNRSIDLSNQNDATEQREPEMEGENLGDLSTISSADFSLIRDQNMDGADLQDETPSRNIVDPLDSGSDRPAVASQSGVDKERKYRDDTTGDDSERGYNKGNSPRKEKDRMRMSKERDVRYSDRRSEKDRRNDRERGGDDRKYRRNKENKYDTEDTDYYSDRERERRRYREGSYSSRPPRADERGGSVRRDDKERRKRDDRDRRYDTYDSERDGKRRDKDRSSSYYDDRDKNYSSLRRDKGREDRGRGDPRDPRYGPPPRPSSRDPEPTEDELNELNLERENRRSRRSRDDHGREDDRERRSHRDRRDRRERGYPDDRQYYDRYGGYQMDPYTQQMYQQHQTYQYYEKLRLTNPQAYLEIYNKYMAGQAIPGLSSQTDLSRGYNIPAFDTSAQNRLGDDRGSVHSGRSSANGEVLKDSRLMSDAAGNYYYQFRRINDHRLVTPPIAGLRGDSSIRTDHSGSRDFNTDASLHMGLEELTVKSERMTPVMFATAHVKGVLSSLNLVTIIPSYPTDGQPAVVEILNLNKILLNDPVRCELTAYPGPLIKGTTHKKTVIEYCETKIRAALEKHSVQDRSLPTFQQYQAGNSFPDKLSSSASPEIGSYILMWELLVLLLRQNGIVVGTDIAELLVKNKRQFEWKGAIVSRHSRRESGASDLETTHSSISNHVEQSQNNEVEQDSSNDVSADHSLSNINRKENRKPARKTSSNLNLDATSHGEKYVTDRFREYLLFGNGKEALEWAMSHGLWGHALFLASKMDRRTYSNVMTRFANGLAANDPLQTLYQLMSGKQPAAATSVYDEKWGDWRPHLAMILSNASQRPDLDKRSITALGDTLQSRGDLYAAQFCYLMARVEFTRRPEPPTGGSTPRLILLGANPTSTLPLNNFISNESVIMTEIYEYACSLADDNFVLHDFQFYKYLFATRLTDYSLYERAFFYMEKLANIITASPDKYEAMFVEKVLELAERLKNFDPEDNANELPDDQDHGDYGSNQQNYYGADQNSNEQNWITSLRKIVNDFNSGVITTHSPQPPHSAPTPSDYDYTSQTNSQFVQQPQSSWNQVQYQNTYDSQQQQQQQQQQYYQPQPTPQQEYQPPQDNVEVPTFYENNSAYFTPANQSYADPDPPPQQQQAEMRNEYNQEYPSWNQDQYSGYNEPEVGDGNKEIQEDVAEDTPITENNTMTTDTQPLITMPNASRNQYGQDVDADDLHNSTESNHKASETLKAQPAKPKDAKSKEAKPPANSGGGWFGGIFNKLSLKPKNQMILPDDKNPSIVWDPEKKKWTNLDADEDDTNNQLAPPPKMSDLMRPNNNNYQPPQAAPPPSLMPSSLPSLTPQATSTPTADPSSYAPPSANATPNIFKLQKSRHIKKSYVDVFNPSGAPMKPLPPASEVLGAPLSSVPAPTSYFVPQPSSNQNSGFYDPNKY